MNTISNLPIPLLPHTDNKLMQTVCLLRENMLNAEDHGVSSEWSLMHLALRIVYGRFRADADPDTDSLLRFGLDTVHRWVQYSLVMWTQHVRSGHRSTR